jgi:hypothetical protein
MPRSPFLRSLGLLSFVALTLLAHARPAVASDPFATYVVPTLVELQPSEEAATRVVIHGAFMQLMGTTNFTYSDPRCGVMYFACMAGQEAMCRMQWQELKAAIAPAPTLCRGFGNKQVPSTATVYVEGQPLGAPDSWDLGLGIGVGSYIDGKCQPATKLSCPLSGANDGGAGGESGAGGAPGAGGAAGTPGAGGARAGAPGTGGISAGAPGTGGSVMGAAGAGGAVTGAGAAAGAAEKPKPGPGCAMAGTDARSGSPLVALALGALVAGVHARRRRR